MRGGQRVVHILLTKTGKFFIKKMVNRVAKVWVVELIASLASTRGTNLGDD